MAAPPKSLKSLKGTHCEFDTMCAEVFQALDAEMSKPSANLLTKLQRVESNIVQVYECLLETETDPDIRTIKMASLLGTSRNAVRLDLSNIPYLGQFCTFYYTSLYQTYVTQVIGHSGNKGLEKKYKDDRRKARDFAIMSLGSLPKQLEDIIKNEAEYNSFYDIVLFLDFMKKKYSYITPNYELTDFLMSYSKWTEAGFSDKKVYTPSVENKPSLYGEHYNRGCNCICGTVAITSMLRLLSTRDRISADSEDITLVDDHTSDSGCHIFLRWKNINIETTNDSILISDEGPFGIMVHMDKVLSNSEHIQKAKLDEGDAYSIVPGNKLEQMLINEHVVRNDYAFPYWHSRGHLADESQDLSVIGRPTVSAAETFVRTLRLLETFPTSKHLLDSIIGHIQVVANPSARFHEYIGGDMRQNPPPTYEGQNAVQAGCALSKEITRRSKLKAFNKTRIKDIEPLFRTTFSC